MSEPRILKESDLPVSLERRRSRALRKTKYAQVTRLKNHKLVTFKQNGQTVIDVIAWHPTLQGAKPSIEHAQRIFDGKGYPRGRTAELVELGA